MTLDSSPPQTVCLATPSANSDTRLRNMAPNGLSITRILLAVPAGILLARSHSGFCPGAAAIFVVAGLTDFLDGLLARRWAATSSFGKFLDQFADKLIIGMTVVLLVHLNRISWIGLELLAVRSLIKSSMILIRGRPFKFAPSRSGKLAAVLLYLSLGCMTVTHAGSVWPLWIYWSGIACAVYDVPLKLLDIVSPNLRLRQFRKDARARSLHAG